MAKKSGDSVYKVVQLVGTSAKSWEEAAKNAVETAAANAARFARGRNRETRHDGR
jgi:flavin-binding protein dodecin